MKTLKNTKPFFSKPLVVVGFGVLCTLIWGSAFPCIKIGYQLFAIDNGFSEILFAGIRFTIAGTLTIAVACIMKKKFVYPAKRDLGNIAATGLVQTTAHYVLFYIAIANTTAIRAAVIGATGTFFAVIIAHFAYKNDKMNLIKTAGCIVGFSGIVIMNLGGGAAANGGMSTTLGDVLMLFTALSFAFGSFLSKKATQKSDAIMITGYYMLFGGLVLLIIGLLGGGHFQNPGMGGFVLIAYMGVAAAIAFTIWSVLLKYNPMSKIAIYNFLIPIFGSVLSAIFLGEDILEFKNLVALILVCFGIFIINKPKKKPLTPADQYIDSIEPME